MRPKIYLSVLFLLALNFCKAQEPIVLDTSMFDKNYQEIYLASLNGWTFHEGNDLKWGEKDIDTIGWKKFIPGALSVKNADKNGRAEGWFRLYFKLDGSFSNVPIALQLRRWMAMDVYIDGVHVASLGNTGADGKPYEEGRSSVNCAVTPLSLKPEVIYIIAIHFVDYVSPLTPYALKSQFESILGAAFAGPETQKRTVANLQEVSVYFTFYTAICFAFCLLLWFLYYQNRSEKILLLISLSVSFLFFSMLSIDINGATREISFLPWILTVYVSPFCSGLIIAIDAIILTKIFTRKTNVIFFIFIAVLATEPLLTWFFNLPAYIDIVHQFLLAVTYLGIIISSHKKLRGAQWAVAIGVASTFIFTGIFYIIGHNYQWSWPFPYCYILLGTEFLSFPLSLVIYVAMRFKEILSDVQTNAQQVVQLSEEKKEQALKQQKILEEEVARQTIELRTSLQELKSTQSQLIQAEKMASLGELTAGIAHEIQNPLNFVNNFSEVNREMVDEATEEINKGNYDELKIILIDIKENSEKINHHGKRADAIVKGMLQHSKQTKGIKEPTDINALCDEYLRLSYHGLCAKDKDFNADIETSFDETIEKINIVPQDIGRVLLNLYNNAFHAVEEKKKTVAENYRPCISVETTRTNDKVVVAVKDNGNGIPQNIVDKIFQPFFTTKPTGQGTGLGLSLSYDIIKAHGGGIKVETNENEETKFIIELPLN